MKFIYKLFATRWIALLLFGTTLGGVSQKPNTDSSVRPATRSAKQRTHARSDETGRQKSSGWNEPITTTNEFKCHEQTGLSSRHPTTEKAVAGTMRRAPFRNAYRCWAHTYMLSYANLLLTKNHHPLPLINSFEFAFDGRSDGKNSR